VQSTPLGAVPSADLKSDQGPASIRSEPGPRLNPFAFPADTDLRFVLLVAAVVGISLFMYYSLSFRLNPVYKQAVQTCSASAEASGEATGADIAQCLAGADRITVTYPLVGIVIVLGLAYALYWATPTWKIRRDGLVPFTDEDDPELIALVAELSRQAGLDRPPIILTNADMSPSGLAFGRFNQHYLVLNAGLIMQYLMDPPAFRAVVLHELAHLRNGDVDKTYFALAAGVAVVVGAVLPYLIVVVAPELLQASLGDVANQLWRIVVALLLIYGPTAGILRARELYADVRASAWDGPEGGLRSALAQLEPTADTTMAMTVWEREAGLRPAPPPS
jgi:Zn-dependent protease with chaperone function